MAARNLGARHASLPQISRAIFFFFFASLVVPGLVVKYFIVLPQLYRLHHRLMPSFLAELYKMSAHILQVIATCRTRPQMDSSLVRLNHCSKPRIESEAEAAAYYRLMLVACLVL